MHKRSSVRDRWKRGYKQCIASSVTWTFLPLDLISSPCCMYVQCMNGQHTKREKIMYIKMPLRAFAGLLHYRIKPSGFDHLVWPVLEGPSSLLLKDILLPLIESLIWLKGHTELWLDLPALLIIQNFPLPSGRRNEIRLFNPYPSPAIRPCRTSAKASGSPLSQETGLCTLK